MKKMLFTTMLMMAAGFLFGQTTYYWVGGTANVTNGINTGSNWNTVIDGSGSSRPSSSGSSDILIFDGTNLGGSTPATGPAAVLASSSITCAQLKFVNNVDINLARPTSGTSTITIVGELGEDFVVETGSSLTVNSPTGSIRVSFDPGVDACRVSGNLSLITAQQMRFQNGTSGTPGTFIFTSGSTFTTNITSSSSSYAFGSSSQSSEKWVVFEDGSHLYYEGGYSPNGSSSTFSPIEFKPGSFWHHRADAGAGSFFNRRSFGHILVENGATLAADGAIYQISDLTINSGCTFTTHTSGQTVVLGNLLVNGTLAADPGSTNELVLAGNAQQTVSGTGSINVGGLMIAANADVVLNKSISVNQAVNVIGKLNLNNNQLTGDASFSTKGIAAPGAGTGNTVTGSTMITGNVGIGSNEQGYLISGAGIAPNTAILFFSSTGDSIYISNPLTADGTGVALATSTNGATLATANLNGFDPVTGTVVVTGNQTYDDHLNYIINGATTIPFGLSTGMPASAINAAFVEINAAVTLNRSVTVSDHFTLNGKVILKPLDILHLSAGAALTGTFGSANYIATDYNSTTGEQSFLQVDGLAASTVLPIGTVNYYLPVTITPVAASDFTAAVFEGITVEGTVNGTPFTPSEKQTVVNAVWNLNRLNGAGDAAIQLGWDAALEGSTFITLPNTDIGLIANNGTSWALPIGVGDNTNNTVAGTVSNFGAFGAGAIPQVAPFVFNPIPDKVYGDADFNGGATSLNTTQPIVYTSSNTAVATISGGNIHITGAGSTNITASQASDGFYPAASITQPLTVTKANLIIKADNLLRFEGLPNPTLTVTYTSFVLGENESVFLTPLVVTTTATAASAPGTYPISVSGATAANYQISFVDGLLTVQAKQNQTITFNAIAAKTYGDADFNAGATSTNNTIPVTYSSSNTAVATVTGGTIHITGAGTTTITASQAGNDGYFPAADKMVTFTVNKAPLTIRVDDATKSYGEPNPAFVISYSGFVLAETAANLTSQATVATTAGTNTSPGLYALTPEGAQSQNYSFNYIAGQLTILPATGTDQQYFNAYQNGNNNITVKVYSPSPVLGDIRVYDIQGRFLARRNLFMPEGFISAEVPVKFLQSGMYIVTITGEGVKLQKLIHVIK